LHVFLTCFKKINFLGHWSFFNPLLTNIMWKMWPSSLLFPDGLNIPATGSFLPFIAVLGCSWKWNPSVIEVLKYSESLSYYQHMVALFLSVSLFNEGMHFNYWYTGTGKFSFQVVYSGWVRWKQYYLIVLYFQDSNVW
jgi:hypothetical protein